MTYKKPLHLRLYDLLGVARPNADADENADAHAEVETVEPPAASTPVPELAPVGDGLDSVPRIPTRSIASLGATYAECEALYPAIGTPSELLARTDRNGQEKIDMFIDRGGFNKQKAFESLKNDDIEVPDYRNRETYWKDFDVIYWLSGYQDYLGIGALAAQHGIQQGRFFDFGGSTGRLFRHFARNPKVWDTWSCDFKATSVDFNLKYFPSNVKVFMNTAFPALPIPDGYFDLVAACSVFTHINESETSWLLELRRVMKVGGIACMSIHNDATWLQMNDHVRKTLKQFRPDIADRETIPPGKTVITWRTDDPYNCNTFHTDEYVRSNWGRYFEVLEIIPYYLNWDGKQAMVVLRRVD